MKKSVRTLKGLSQAGLIKESNIPSLEAVVENFSVAISQQMLSQINITDPNDPVARQFIPDTKELNITAIELQDPIGDQAHSPIKGIIHRYPDRCLFTPVLICPVYCRFCFRREKVGLSDETLTLKQLEEAYEYIQNHPEIWEVIITGGDPLILKPNQLKKIIQKLNSIEHVAIIRIHTRIPLVESSRINTEMLDALKSDKPIYIIIHANHPNEFTTEGIKACADLVNAGIPLLSQTVLLKNLNDNIEILSELMRCFLKNKIKPYYLHHADLAKGTQHFRTSIETGQQLIKQLRGRFSGLCQPIYVLDIPGGYGKVPVGPGFIHKKNDNEYLIEDYQGNIHSYFSV